ncbi:MAG: isopentenyl phosphate kinase [Candidatus Micrarchaeota archaeon]
MKVLKIGGSFITEKSGYKKALPKRIKEMAKVVADVRKKGITDLVIIHGAGSFGHALVLKHGINEGVNNDEQKLGFADTHAACSELSLHLVRALIEEGVPAVSIPPAAVIRQSRKRIMEFNDGIVKEYLSMGYVPVLYGDMTPDSELGGSVCSGDQIMAWFGKEAEFLVFATNVDGVLDENGEIIPEISPDNFKDVSKHLKETKNDVTGAMKGKIGELLALDTVSYIVNGGRPDMLEAIILGKEAPCTKISPKS